MGKPRVCVIGAGSSGIASCQVLKARGISFARGGLAGAIARHSHELRFGSPG